MWDLNFLDGFRERNFWFPTEHSFWWGEKKLDLTQLIFSIRWRIRKIDGNKGPSTSLKKDRWTRTDKFFIVREKSHNFSRKGKQTKSPPSLTFSSFFLLNLISLLVLNIHLYCTKFMIVFFILYLIILIKYVLELIIFILVAHKITNER
jgi:hypothetical protein